MLMASQMCNPNSHLRPNPNSNPHLTS